MMDWMRSWLGCANGSAVMQRVFGLIVAGLFVVGESSAEETLKKSDAKSPDSATIAPAKSVEQLAESAKKSVVVITFIGRDGKRQGLGTGFVVESNGLIATNLHVIGEARPVSVQTADGKRYDVKAVHASDRSLDLALIKIDANKLPALELGDSDKLKQGQAVVALGNPQGLEHSVVAGVVSAAKREIDG